MSIQIDIIDQRCPESSPDRTTTLIQPPRGWQLVNVRELWQFRELIFFLAWRDVKVRYKQTALGAAWAILQPAMMMVIFTIFFGRLANVPRDDIPYSLFVFAGLLPWTFFATAINSSGNSVVGSERLITKIYFPRLAVPFAAVGATVVDFIAALTLMLGLMFWYQVRPGWSLLLAPLVFSAILLAATGVGTFLAALNVAYRDFRYVMAFMIQMWMFATPTVYMQPTGTESGYLQALLNLNPMTGLIATFRATVLDRPIPWNQFAVSFAWAVLLFLGGCFYFRKVEDSFADII